MTRIRPTSEVKLKPVEKVFVKLDKREESPSTPDPLMDHPTSTEEDKLIEKNVIAILPDGSEILNDEDSTLISMDHVNVQEIDESRLMKVKQELCEVKQEKVISFIFFIA